jgi:hypothetical protein
MKQGGFDPVGLGVSGSDHKGVLNDQVASCKEIVVELHESVELSRNLRELKVLVKDVVNQM